MKSRDLIKIMALFMNNLNKIKCPKPIRADSRNLHINIFSANFASEMKR